MSGCGAPRRCRVLLRRVEVRPGVLGDVRARDWKIAEIGPAVASRGEQVVDGVGGALLPGLHDHHCHLLATAAAADSVPCGPPEATTLAGLEAALRSAVQSRAANQAGWVRGVGYDDAVAGPLDRSALDRLPPHMPVPAKHPSVALQVLIIPRLEA